IGKYLQEFGVLLCFSLSLEPFPKRDQDFSKPKSDTHIRRSPRICVGSKQLTFEAHVGRAKRDSILANPFQKPHICVEQQAYAWKASSMPKISKIHVYA
ncbi:hypothetical protein PIB30_112760, partial [Stylosanthes scabra]|nr:hypothetical protein [Stylosanthes scabra]